MGRVRDDATMRASEKCCELYISRGTTSLTVAELTAAIGISARSFHRYFPTKADTVQPVFDWTTDTFNTHVRTAPPGPLTGVLRDGFRVMLGGPHAARTRALFPLVFADPGMWSVFLRAVHHGETTLAEALAPRLGSAPDAVSTRTAAAAVASATRLALEGMARTGQDPEPLFDAHLDAFASGVLAGAR
ncbi:TetR/AcrR family transcriptional regulator [Streptomyces xiamenensis]